MCQSLADAYVIQRQAKQIGGGRHIWARSIRPLSYKDQIDPLPSSLRQQNCIGDLVGACLPPRSKP